MTSNKKPSAQSDKLELWGGYECTVNRVGDRWHDQTPRTGHEHRISDLASFAGLGMRSLRYPALWERMSPDRPDRCDFGWTDERLPEIRRLGMEPIVTLCHHGSGPVYTSLIDESFAPGLARHAAAVAERYPWLRDWTPVNEPLTTARFSALYGFWYPHTRDERLFWLALLNEIDATRLSMRAIRRVNPAARLIQTDDLGYCHATPPLQGAADFQNERRWIGWDLLCGMVVPGHALWDRLAAHGFGERLRAIADDSCPPDVIGVNHYLSSERLLDHRIELHGARSLADRAVGRTDGVMHVDVDAISSWRQGVIGLPRLLEQAWERYRRPLAVTECHHGTTRCEQARWFVEVWNGVDELRSRGVDVRAVTAWSLLGSNDWNRMLTRFDGHYETGVFDVRSGTPRPTMLTGVLRDLAAGEQPTSPVLHAPGRWRCEKRFRDSVPDRVPRFEMSDDPRPADAPAPLFIIADDGRLSQLAVEACETRKLFYVRCSGEIEPRLAATRPWAVLDARDRDGLAGRQGEAPLFGFWSADRLADVCVRHDLPCATLASHTRRGHRSGASRLLTIRTSSIYTAGDGSARATQMLDALDAGHSVTVDANAPWTMVYGPDLIDGVIDLLLDGARGPATFVIAERLSEADFARTLAAIAGADPAKVIQVGALAGTSEARSELVSYLPPLETTLDRFVRERRLARRVADVPSSVLVHGAALIAAE